MGIARDYNRAPSLTKDVFWIEARPPAEADPDLRLVGEWLLYVVSRKLDESWDKVRKATMDSRLGFLSKSATAKKNYNMPSASNRMIVVYTSNYYEIDDVLRVGRELNDLGFGISTPIYYESDDARYAHRHLVK
jgi:hypothetical protein